MNQTAIVGQAVRTDTAISALIGNASAGQSRKRSDESDTLLTDPNICALFGGISRMTLWRWRQDLGFPTASHDIGGRRYTWKSQVLSWLAERPYRPLHPHDPARNGQQAA